MSGIPVRSVPDRFSAFLRGLRGVDPRVSGAGRKMEFSAGIREEAPGDRIRGDEFFFADFRFRLRPIFSAFAVFDAAGRPFFRRDLGWWPFLPACLVILPCARYPRPMVSVRRGSLSGFLLPAPDAGSGFGFGSGQNPVLSVLDFSRALDSPAMGKEFYSCGHTRALPGSGLS